MVNRKQAAFLAMKGVNLGLATVMSFALVWVLIRKLPLAAYSTFVLIAAMGAYVMATDLGFSAVIYHRVRSAFLRGRPEEARALAVTAFGLYLAIAGLAELLMIAWLAIGGAGHGLSAAFSVYFLALALALPWGVLRSVAGALDHFLLYEGVEAARRALLTAMIAAMAFGLPLLAYAAIALAAWPLAYAILLPRLARTIGAGGWRGVWRPLEALRENGRMMGAASVFSLMEFGVYNFPYIALPYLFGYGPALVVFDIFFKVTRFGASAYLVPNESLLPLNTRAIHDGDGRRLLRNVIIALGLSALACAVGCIAVTAFGDALFRALLKNGALVAPRVRWCMAVVLAAMMFQAASGTLLVNSGKMGVLSRVSVGMALSMSAMTAAAAVLHWSFPGFMQAYASVYAVGAVIYFSLLVASVARLLGPQKRW
jgi:O-antigen/teichoic acid export membrane protein